MKLINIILGLIICSGCAVTGFNAPEVILLPEDRLFTIEAGSTVDVIHDGKKIKMTFVDEMIVAHSSTMIRHEELLVKETHKAIKATKQKKQAYGVFGSILTILSSVFVIWRRKGKLKKLTLSAE